MPNPIAPKTNADGFDEKKEASNDIFIQPPQPIFERLIHSPYQVRSMLALSQVQCAKNFDEKDVNNGDNQQIKDTIQYWAKAFGFDSFNEDVKCAASWCKEQLSISWDMDQNLCDMRKFLHQDSNETEEIYKTKNHFLFGSLVFSLLRRINSLSALSRYSDNNMKQALDFKYNNRIPEVRSRISEEIASCYKVLDLFTTLSKNLTAASQAIANNTLSDQEVTNALNKVTDSRQAVLNYLSIRMFPDVNTALEANVYRAIINVSVCIVAFALLAGLSVVPPVAALGLVVFALAVYHSISKAAAPRGCTGLSVVVPVAMSTVPAYKAQKRDFLWGKIVERPVSLSKATRALSSVEKRVNKYEDRMNRQRLRAH